MDKVERLIPIIKKITRNQKPGKKILQKVVYLIQRKGVKLGFAFSIHYYGPYSSELDYAIHRLEMQGVLSIIPEGMTHQISLKEDADLSGREETEVFSEEQLQKIDEVIAKFAGKPAYDLEVITTTDYVAQQLKANGESWENDNLIEGVRRIKGDKFSKEEIERAIAILQAEGYLGE
jgi:uncharacterized protein YwgA